MIELKLKTNIKCDACVGKVTPFLDGEPSIEKWEVNLTHPDRILTVQGANISVEKISAILKNAGYAVNGEV